MAQLETLEAKMASIEVSLSSTPRRKKLNGIALSSIRSIPKELAAKELEHLRNALRDKENIIQSLKGQLTMPGLRLTSMLGAGNNNNNGTIDRELSEVEKRQAEERLGRLKTDIDNKRLAIKNLKMALERLDITDNIDVRIQQAELEYQLGREELNLLTLLEETRALQLCIEESNKCTSESNSLYSCVKDKGNITLQAVEVEYDPKSPKFVAGQKDNAGGLWIDWALEDTNLRKADRLIEVNGKIVLTKNRDELARLLAAAPDPAQIVVLRKLADNTENGSTFSKSTAQEVSALRSELEVMRERGEEARKIKEGLKSDNIRLTHRISYLEEQVSELLSRKSDSETTSTSSPVISKTTQNVTSINIGPQHSPVPSNASAEIQVFQKGPQVTALVSNVPNIESKDNSGTRSKSSLSNVSNTHIPAPSPQPDYNCYRSHKHRSPRHNMKSYEPLDNVTYRKHHHHHREKDYNSETNSNGVPDGSRYRRRNPEHRYSADFSRTSSEKEYPAHSIADKSYKKAAKIVQDLTRNGKDGNLYEKHRQKCITASEKYNVDILKHYNARKSTSVVDFRSEVHIGPRYDSRSVEELDAGENHGKSGGKAYKKIQNSCSVKSLDFDSDCNSTKNGYKSADCNSEVAENNKRSAIYHNYYDGKPKPVPPKKPLRLSLHKTHSLQSVDSSNNDAYNGKNESRKRNHRGEIPLYGPGKVLDNGDVHIKEQAKWTNYRTMDNGLEQGTWC
ncbi:transcription initiation factor TFIID subunit 1 isoform X2 [Cylas formicarius]|nr:transcription initiation factor TFIID subunit 1 isoform X2 [Cylas formicarius]